MAWETGADERDPLDQVVYRWSYGDLFGRQGMGPVAGSLDRELVQEWDRGLNSHVSMDRSLPETPDWSMCQVHLPGERHALILREAAIHASNRPGNNAHVLLDPERMIRPHTMLAAVWLHDRYGGGLTGSGIPSSDVRDDAALGTASIRPEAYRADVHETIRAQARENAELVEVVLAAVMRNEGHKFTLLTEHVGEDVVSLLWGVFDLARWVAPGGRTFSTYETSDAAMKPSFVLVPRWPNTPEPANRVRIDPRAEPGQDVFRRAARILVSRYCEWSWDEMLGTLREVDDAVGTHASNLDRAEHVVGPARRTTPPMPTAGRTSRDDPAGGVDSPVVGWSKLGYSQDLGTVEYTDTFTQEHDEQDEQDEQCEQGGPGRYFDPDGPDRAGGHARAGRDAPGAGDLGDRLAAWTGRVGSGPTVSGPARPASTEPIRPGLPRETSARSARGTWDWDVWDELMATRDGLTALRQAAELMAENGGQETPRVGRAIDRADTGSLAAALLLVEPPLLEAVIWRLAVEVDREYANPRREWRSLRAYGEILGRLHEGIPVLAGCDVEEELLHILLEKMARMVAQDSDRFPHFVAGLAGTVMRLRTFDGDWTPYQRILVRAMSTTDCYGLLQRECGRLLFEELGITP
ncbi:hypothetical protein ACFZBU_30580 [Embleya sp. NPDC008237]|uniref:hypothetical protein n=1 Tax=Embleya sp. NPDC008237 TaxID=3363978 RepID=UPI0036E97206